jgi:hypothetical protein
MIAVEKNLTYENFKRWINKTKMLTMRRVDLTSSPPMRIQISSNQQQLYMK